MPAPTAEITRESGYAASAPTSPPASARPFSFFVASYPAKGLGFPRASERMPSSPIVMTVKPMNIRTRSSGATSRSSDPE